MRKGNSKLAPLSAVLEVLGEGVEVLGEGVSAAPGTLLVDQVACQEVVVIRHKLEEVVQV
jgi:hypothetical protein